MTSSHSAAHSSSDIRNQVVLGRLESPLFSSALTHMTAAHVCTRLSQVEFTVHGRYVRALILVHLLFNTCQANAIGRSSKTVREFLEKNHKDDLTREESIKLTVKSLLEVVQTGAKNIEISVMESYGKVTVRVANFYTASFLS